ncbi:helix-turn-helix domain-containing protein [Verrucomicrobiota bacterium]
MALGEELRLAREKMGLTASEVGHATRIKVQIIEGIEREDFTQIAAAIYARGFIKLYAEYVGLDPDPLLHEFTESCLASKRPSLISEEPPPPAPGEEEDAAPEPEGPPEEDDDEEEADLFSRIDTGPVHADVGSETGKAEAQKSALLESARRTVAGSAEAIGRKLGAVRQSFRDTASTLREKARQPVDRSRVKGPTVKVVSVIVGVVIVLLFLGSGLSRCVRWPERDVSPASPEPPETAETVEELRVAVDLPPPYFD